MVALVALGGVAMPERKAPAVEAHDELLFSLAEALARQLPRKRRARFVRDWLAITTAMIGATPIHDGASEAARRAAAAKIRERAPDLVTKLLG